MKKTLITTALLMMVGVPGAFAQGGASGSSAAKGGGSMLQAPIGHRQPRASDVPDEKSLSNPNDSASKEDAMLNRKIKSICRGC